jgi:DNA-binding HxlR family transcriptional regulator
LYKDELSGLENNLTDDMAQKLIKNTLKELENPERMEIFKKLYHSKYPLSIYTIAEKTIEHLTVLEDMGLISQITIGNTQKYHLTDFGNEIMNMNNVISVNKKVDKIQTGKEE